MKRIARTYLADIGVYSQYKLKGSQLKLDFCIEQKNRCGNDIQVRYRMSRCATLSENIILEYVRCDENVAQRIEEIVRKYHLVAQ